VSRTRSPDVVEPFFLHGSEAAAATVEGRSLLRKKLAYVRGDGKTTLTFGSEPREGREFLGRDCKEEVHWKEWKGCESDWGILAADGNDPCALEVVTIVRMSTARPRSYS
jgi:hypothetical protein